MEPVIDDASMVPSDSSLGYGPTTRGPTQGLAGNFGGVVRSWILDMENRRFTGYWWTEGKLLIRTSRKWRRTGACAH